MDQEGQRISNDHNRRREAKAQLIESKAACEVKNTRTRLSDIVANIHRGQKDGFPWVSAKHSPRRPRLTGVLSTADNSIYVLLAATGPTGNL